MQDGEKERVKVGSQGDAVPAQLVVGANLVGPTLALVRRPVNLLVFLAAVTHL